MTGAHSSLAFERRASLTSLPMAAHIAMIEFYGPGPEQSHP